MIDILNNYPQLTKLTSALTSILGENLHAVYLHGSAALGSFHPGSSDLDLLILTADLLTPTQRRQLGDTALRLSGNPHPLEFSVLSRADLASPFPQTYQFHYSEAWRTRLRLALAQPADLPPPAEALPPIPRTDLLRSLAPDLRDGLDNLPANPAYGILNACRSLAWLQDGSVLSKDEGGEWFLRTHSHRFDALVRAALARQIIPPALNGELADFVDFMQQALAPFWSAL